MTDTPTPDVRGLIERWHTIRQNPDEYIGEQDEAGDALAAALEATITVKEVEEECVVCHAALWPREGPPHCHDCHPSEEDQLDWEHGKRKPAPPPAATGDEELLARVLDVCRNQCSIEGALTLDTLATRFRVRGVDLRRMRESRDAAEKMAHLYADERNELRESLAAATERAEEAVLAERRAAIEKCERLVIYYQSHGGVHSEAASMGCEDCISAIRGDLHFIDAGFITRPAPTGDKEEVTK